MLYACIGNPLPIVASCLRYAECGVQTESLSHLVEQAVEQAVYATFARMEASLERRTANLISISETLKRGRDDLRVAVRAADVLLRGSTGVAADQASKEFLRYSWDASQSHLPWSRTWRRRTRSSGTLCAVARSRGASSTHCTTRTPWQAVTPWTSSPAAPP